MAKGISFKVRLGGFKWNRAGYAAVLNSAPVISLVKGEADEIAASCNSTFTPGEGDSSEYRVKRVKGRLATGYVVRTYGDHAHYSERKHNRLRKALGGG